MSGTNKSMKPNYSESCLNLKVDAHRVVPICIKRSQLRSPQLSKLLRMGTSRATLVGSKGIQKTSAPTKCNKNNHNLLRVRVRTVVARIIMPPNADHAPTAEGPATTLKYAGPVEE